MLTSIVLIFLETVSLFSYYYYLVVEVGPPRLANMYIDSVKSNLLFQTPDAVFPKHIFSDYLSKSLSVHPRHIQAIVN